MKTKSVREAMAYAADHQVPDADPIDTPMWHLLCLQLFEVANNPQVKVRGSLNRATRAQRMILDRMVGRRRAGTHPVEAGKKQVDFVDLTAGLIQGGSDE